MSVYYTIAKRTWKNNFSPTPEKKQVYKIAIFRNPDITLNQVAETTAWATSLSKGDILGILTTFAEAVAVALADGNSLKIDGLGVFSVRVRSKSVEAVKDATLTTLKPLDIDFLPDVEIKKDIIKKDIHYVEKDFQKTYTPPV